MLEQDRFARELSAVLTPLQFRDGGARDPVDPAAWYNTPGVAVAAATASASRDLNACHVEWGARRPPGDPRPDANTLFQACSVSKAFQGLAVLHYISEGVISGLDDSVRPYLTEATCRALLDGSVRRGMPRELAAQMFERTTVAQLLSHTAGSTASGFMGYPTSSGHIPTMAEVLQGGFGNANSAAIFVHAVPGVQFEYSGGGSTILQAMLENIGASRDGFASFADLMRAKVLEPLGMKRSFYCGGAALPEPEKNYAAGYHNGVHGLEAGEYHIHPEQGAAGLWTTPTDLVKGMTGFAYSLLGTASAITLNEKPWIRPEVAQAILQRRPDLGHGQSSYYCGFNVAFLDGEDDLRKDKNLVRISHAGGNYGYRCWAAAVLPLPSKLEGSKEDAPIAAQAVMTNANYGGEIVGPVVLAVGEMLDSPLGPGGTGSPYSECTPAVALDPEPAAPKAGWDAYAGDWVIKDRTQTLRIMANPRPAVAFSHLQDVELPLWAVAERRGPELLRLRISSLDAMLEFSSFKEGDETSLTLCTAGSKIKCSRPRSGELPAS